MKITKNLYIHITVLFTLMCAFFIFFVGLPVFANDEDSNIYGFDFAVSSDAIYFINVDTGTVIFEKNKNKKIPAAALVKMMTISLILESISPDEFDEVLGQELVAKQEIFDRLYRKEAANSDIRNGEKVCIRDLIYASILRSACEATMMLVEHFSGGDVDGFVKKMNLKAKEIGLKNTNFTDPDGLDVEAQFTTAYDAYLLTKHCFKNQFFAKVATTSSYEMQPTNKHEKSRTIIHSNYMTNIGLGGKQYYDKRVQGIKTGAFANFYNLISMAKNETYTYMLVVLGAPKNAGENGAFADSNNFYNFAFKNLKFETVSVPGEKFIPNHVKVNLGQSTDNLVLTTKNQVTLLLPKSIDSSTIFWDTSNLPKEVLAPIKKGRKIGTVNLKLAGKTIATVETVACENVELDFLAFIYVCIVKVFKYLWIVVLVVVLFFLILWFIEKNNSNKRLNFGRKIKFKKRNRKKIKVDRLKKL